MCSKAGLLSGDSNLSHTRDVEKITSSSSESSAESPFSLTKRTMSSVVWLRRRPVTRLAPRLATLLATVLGLLMPFDEMLSVNGNQTQQCMFQLQGVAMHATWHELQVLKSIAAAALIWGWSLGTGQGMVLQISQQVKAWFCRYHSNLTTGTHRK